MKARGRKSALNIFLTKSNPHNVGVLSIRIEDMDALSLIYWLKKFVMEEAKKSDMEKGILLSTTVYGIVCGIRR